MSRFHYSEICRVLLSQRQSRREVIVTHKEFSTYAECVFGLWRLHILHCVVFCITLQQIQYPILYQTLRYLGSLFTTELRSICYECLPQRDAPVVKHEYVSGLVAAYVNQDKARWHSRCQRGNNVVENLDVAARLHMEPGSGCA